MIKAPSRQIGLRRALMPLFDNFKAPKKLSTQEIFSARWQRLLVEQPLAKLQKRAQHSLTINGTLLKCTALTQLHQQINAGKRFFSKSRYGFTIIVGENHTPYAIYDDLKHVGGSTGNIKLVQNLSNKQFYLLKTATDCEEKTLTESQILDQLGLLESRQFRSTKQGINKSYLILKIIPGFTLDSFKSLCKSHEEVFSLQQQAQIMLSMLEEMQTLIARNIHHGDISDENLLFDPVSMKIKIIDFGDASLITKASHHHQHYDLHKCYFLLKPILQAKELTAIADKYIHGWKDLENNLNKAIEEVRALCSEATCRKKI